MVDMYAQVANENERGINDVVEVRQGVSKGWITW